MDLSNLGTLGFDRGFLMAFLSAVFLVYLLFCLGPSIPFVRFMGNVLSQLMDEYPLSFYVGASIFGKVAREVMVTEPYAQRHLPTGPFMERIIQAAAAGTFVP
jgi:hypothetical protein